jgi:hypothetical protein
MAHAPYVYMHTNKESRHGRARTAMRELGNLPQRSLVDVDPEDPSQLLDDADQYSVVDLDLEAKSRAEADAELDAAVANSAGEGAVVGVEGGLEDEDETDVEEDSVELDTPSQTTADATAKSHRDSGDLYGVHLTRAADNDLDVNPDRESFVDSTLGEHAFETLEKKMVENGPTAEADVVIIDETDSEAGHHPTESGDRPVADKGSGGPSGL